MTMCKHCGERRANRPRGLCNRHYDDKAIRDQYPAQKNRYGGALVRDTMGTQPPGPPTQFKPGSVEKLLQMSDRVAENRPPCSPGDADAGGAGRFLLELPAAERRAALSWVDVSGRVGTSYQQDAPEVKRQRRARSGGRGGFHKKKRL